MTTRSGEHPDYLIVGAGLFGSVMAERIATQLKKRVLVIDKRDHIGGNCYSYKDPDTGIEVHKFGTHIFHTSSRKVWDYINQFTEFNGYYHQVLTTHKGKVYQMPINLETINTFYGISLKPYEVDDFLAKERAREQYPDPKNLEEKAISLIGRPLYEAFIRGYTKKQWGRDPKDLPASIITRLPVRSNYNETYFNNARWQGIPLNGYTSIFERMLEHDLIDVQLDTDYFAIKDQITPVEKTIYTGPVDQFFNYQHGKLDWRSIFLERKLVDHADFQGTSVMNYADEDVDYTRIHEPLHLHPERGYKNSQSVLFYETSGMDPEQPFYPLNDQKNRDLYSQYADAAKAEPNVIFGGRLGTYSYFDMDQVIGQALATFEKLEG